MLVGGKSFDASARLLCAALSPALSLLGGSPKARIACPYIPSLFELYDTHLFTTTSFVNHWGSINHAGHWGYASSSAHVEAFHTYMGLDTYAPILHHTISCHTILFRKVLYLNE